MTKYKLPEWRQSTVRLKTTKKLDVLLKEWEIETDECNIHNNLVHKRRIEKYRQIIEFAIEIWGKTSNEVKKLIDDIKKIV